MDQKYILANLVGTYYNLFIDYITNYTDIHYFAYIHGLPDNAIKHILDTGQLIYNKEINLN